MATDEELLIYNTLNNNWNASNAPLPKFYYTDEIQMHDYRNFTAIKIYTVSAPETPHGIGYTSFETHVNLTIDVRSKTRADMLTIRDEVKRIVRDSRKTLTGYDVFKINSERKVASYINYYQHIFEIELIKYRTNI